MDYNADREWVVISPKGVKTMFKRDTGLCNRMPYIDLRENHEGLAMINTVRERFKNFSREEIERAILSRVVRRRIGHPAEKHCKDIVSENANNFDCPVEIADIDNAHLLFGDHVPALRGHTVRKQPKRVKVNSVRIPRDFYKLHKYVALTADVMFVCGIPFLVTRSRGIKFNTVEFIPSRKAGQLANSLKKVLYLYARGGFIVNVIFMD